MDGLVSMEEVKGFIFNDALFDISKAADEINSDENSPELVKRIVTGYAAVADVIDSQYEVITREALEGAAKDLLSYTTVLYNHDPNRPIGKVLEARPEGSGLFVKVLISNSETEIWEKVTEGVISKFSFRGTVTDYEERFEKSLDRYITVIKGFRVFEISLVSVPANPHARTLHYYLSKALETDKSKTEHSQSSQDNTEKAEKILKGGPEETMDQKDIAKSQERMKLIASLCDKLIAALQDMPHADARLVAIAKKIKAEAMSDGNEDGSNYPKPSAEADMDLENYNPQMEGLKSRVGGLEDKITNIATSLDELKKSLEESNLETIKGQVETLVNEKFTELDAKFDSQSEVIKGFAELLDSLRPVLGLEPAKVETTETGTGTENNQGGES